MLTFTTFNVVLGHQGLLFRDFLWFFFFFSFFFFFQSTDRPTDRPNIRKCIRRLTKKRGMAFYWMGLFHSSQIQNKLNLHFHLSLLPNLLLLIFATVCSEWSKKTLSSKWLPPRNNQLPHQIICWNETATSEMALYLWFLRRMLLFCYFI